MDFKQLKTATGELGEAYVKELYIQLSSLDKKASGKLLRSLDYKVLEVLGKVVLKLEAEGYLKYVNDGRRPGKQPPVSPIKKWIKQKGLKGRDAGGRFIKDDSFAFLVARSIGKKGIRPTGVIEKTIKIIMRTKSDILAEGMTKDLDIELDKIIKNIWR